MQERLAAATSSGRLSVLTLGDATPHRETLAQADAYWPTWRPGSGLLSWSEAAGRTAILHSGQTVPGSETDPPLFLAPRLPHYALWNSQGDRLCYVVSDGRSLVLNVWTAGELAERSLVSGAPIFPAWEPNGTVLVVHHGNTLHRFDLLGGEQTTLSNSAAGFRTPAISPDGRIAWAEVRDGAVHVMEGLADGASPVSRATFHAGVALHYAGESTGLVVAVGQSPESSAFRELQAVEPGRSLMKGVFVAAWWAPDNSRVVALHPSYTGDGRYQARLYDDSGALLQAMEAFVPSSDTATMVSFYDQYNLSHSPWSSSGRWFGLSGRFVYEGPHASFSDGTSDYAWALDTTSGEVERRLCPATMLAFER